LEQACWSDIAEACDRPRPVLRSVTMPNSFWHKWSGYTAISANMRVAGCADTSD
jgi:hypothetical protein